MLSLRPHAKYRPLPASLSTRDFLSARSSRPTSQVPADRGRLLQRLRVRHGHQWQRILSEGYRPPTDTSKIGNDPQRQGALGRLSAPEAERPPSRRSHPRESPAPSLRACGLRERHIHPTPPPKDSGLSAGVEDAPDPVGIYIGRPPRLRSSLPSANPIVAGALRELCKAQGDDLELSRIVLLELRVMVCG